MPPARSDATRRQFLASNIALAALAAIFVIARAVSKRVKKLCWTWDDTFLAVALIFLYVCIAGSIIASTIGHVGRPLKSATPEELEKTLIIIWAHRFPHDFAVTAVRTSICILFIRMFFSHLTLFSRLRHTAHTCIILAVIWLLVSIIGTLVHCRPISYNWKRPPEDVGNHCFNFKPYTIVLAASGLVIDAVTWSLPHFVVWRLRLRRAHKLAITAIFALGLLNIMMGIFRITTLTSVSIDGDTTLGAVSALLWANAQASTAIILACCPLLRPFFEKIMPIKLTRIVRSSSRRSDRGPDRDPNRDQEHQIRVTTRIEVFSETSSPREHYISHDGFNAPEAPTFEVDRPERPKKKFWGLGCWSA